MTEGDEVARQRGAAKRIWYWLSHPDTDKSRIYTAIERLGVILGFLLAVAAVVGGLFAAGRWVVDQVATTTTTTTTSSTPTVPDPQLETTDLRIDDDIDDTASPSTDPDLADGDDDIDPGPIEHPIVVALEGDEGLVQRGFLTPAGYIVTPTQTNLGDQPLVSWRVGADRETSTASFVRVGDDPIVSLYQLDDPTLISVLYGMRNATSLATGDSVEGWLDPLSTSPGEVVTGIGSELQLQPAFTGHEIGLRLNEQERTHVLCARTEQVNFEMEEICAGVAEVFEGQVTSEFIGLEADPSELEATLQAILGASPDIDGIVTTRASAALRTSEAVKAVGRADIVVIATGGLTTDLAAAIDSGDVDSYIPDAYDGTVLTTTLVTGPSDLGIPVREPGADGRVVGMAFAQSTAEDRTYSVPIEILRDLFPEAFA